MKSKILYHAKRMIRLFIVPSAVSTKKQDVSLTVTEFYTCWCNHKSHINTKKKTWTVILNTLSIKHVDCKTLSYPYQKVKVKNLDHLEDRKGHWQ